MGLVGIPTPGSREQVLAALVKLGGQHCGYHHPGAGEWLEHTCDCKYGGPMQPYYNKSLGRVVQSGSEKTGCPELRTLHAVVSQLTDAQWEDLELQRLMEGR